MDGSNRSDAHLLGLLGGVQKPVLFRHHVDVTGTGRMEAAADLVLDPRCDGLDAAGESLLEAHLIAWHQGGAVQIERAAQTGSVRVALPADPVRAEIRESDANWIADQFSLLEP